MFWLGYGGLKGFEVIKSYKNKIGRLGPEDMFVQMMVID